MIFDLAKINEMDEDVLMSEALFDELYAIEDEPERTRVEIQLERRAKELRCKSGFSKLVRSYARERKLYDKMQDRGLSVVDGTEEDALPLKRNFNTGKIEKTIANFVMILRNDEQFANLRYNLFANSPQKLSEDGKLEPWTNTDDSRARLYIEDKYGILHKDNLYDALNVYFHDDVSYHPVKSVIEAVTWDGEERCDKFLTKWLRVDDDDYSREVSRLIFAGGINRVYIPGCKYDTTTVLIGGQGCGKSTICNWLALDDKNFNEITTFEGNDSIEALQGTFIGEIAELLALTKTKEQEAVKMYLTRRIDKSRLAYQLRKDELPRQCIFIATTNKPQFLIDKTGGRRWLPVTVHSDGRQLYKHEKEIKAYILQCWAEALAKFKQGKMPCVADESLFDKIRQQQDNAMEDDYRIGMIQQFLEGRTEVCVIQLWQEALDNPYEKPNRKDSNEIATILNSLGWSHNGVGRFGNYGVQRKWTPPEPQADLPWEED